MKIDNKFIKKYQEQNPAKAKIIKASVKKGVRQYEETFKRLAAT